MSLLEKLIQEHLKEMFSIIYTPTEGEAIQNFSKVFRRPEGCFLNIEDQDRVEDNLVQWGGPEDIDYIVVTDGEEVHTVLSIHLRASNLDQYLDPGYWGSG